MASEPAENTGKTCDGCGRIRNRFWRSHLNKRYCQTCYHKLFKRELCRGCGNFKRLPQFEKRPICTECRKNKPCVRCHRRGRPVHLLTEYGPVCNSCYPYFRTTVRCELCETSTNRPERVTIDSQSFRLCRQCAHPELGTCQACSRHRALFVQPDTRRLCQRCVSLGTIPCPQCTEPMPAGYSRVRCERCYTRDKLGRRLDLSLTAFGSDTVRELFRAFTHWLVDEIGLQKAARTLNDHQGFFVELDERFAGLPDSDTVLRHFGTATLRAAELPMRWLAATGKLIVSDAAKHDESDRRRVQRILQAWPDESHASKLLHGYHRRLSAKVDQGKTSLRSVRLSLSCARSLLVATDTSGAAAPDQESLESYLRKTPGQRNGLSAFVTFLKEAHDIAITLPERDPARAGVQRRNRLRLAMEKLASESRNDADDLRQWHILSLQYHYRVPVRLARQLARQAKESVDEQAYRIDHDGEIYHLPNPPSFVSN